jgi:membrane protease YdiL (CAAX protease family)
MILEYELRRFWGRFFDFNWKFGLFLTLVMCIPRFVLVMEANASGNYAYIGLIMVISAVVPFVFLSKIERCKVGIVKRKTVRWMFITISTGIIFSILLYFLGEVLFDNRVENWYEYIRHSYSIPPGIQGNDKAVLFTIIALTGMTFSPIGEELFVRGIVHASFAKSIGDKKASIADSTAFAVTHISHFGLVIINENWRFLPMPALVWVFCMFCLSLIFFAFKKYSGSILGAIACHAAFNLGMIYCIFYLL